MRSGKSQDTPKHEPPNPGTRGFIIGSLVLYLAFLIATAIWSSRSSSAWDALRWNPDTSNWILQIASHLCFLAIRDVVLFGPLAFLCAAAASRQHRIRAWIDGPLSLVLGFATSLAISLGLRAVMSGFPVQTPSIIVVLFFMLLCLYGSWAGVSWARSHSMAGWFLCQLLSITLYVSAIGFSLAWFGLETERQPVSVVTVASEDRVRLVKMIRKHDPRDLGPQETGQLTLTELDFNQLLAWGLSLVPGDGRAAMQIESSQASLSMTGELPSIPLLGTVVNLHVAGIPMTQDGELGFSLSRFSIGRIEVPRWLLNLSGPIMVDKDWYNDTTRPIFSALQQVTLGENQVTMVYGQLDLPDGFIRDVMVGIGVKEDIAPAVQAHTESLLRLAAENDSLTFGKCMETAFATAAKRSSLTNPIDENRAAILAIGYVLGHPRIKDFVGPEIPEIPAASNRKFRAVTLRGRHDWTRHYTLSAALEVLSNKFASHSIGVLKEELDADGGSGFSFADLLADRAGTQLGVSAAKSADAARAMQQRLAGGFNVDDFMPEGADLPEGLQQETLIEQYGGVGDPRYNRVLTNIDRRISDCGAYSQ